MCLRRSQRRLGGLFGVGTKDGQFHRESKVFRIMDTMKVMAYSVAVVSGSVFVFYGGRKVQHWLWPSLAASLDDNITHMLTQHPDLAVALVHMTAHHALAAPGTPFACPPVAPPSLKAEAEQIAAFVDDALLPISRDLSRADLYAIMATRALLLLGGPDVQPLVGRSNPMSPDTPKKGAVNATSGTSNTGLPVTVPTRCPQDQRDARQLKVLGANIGLEAGELTALIGGLRTLGYHEGAPVRFDDASQTYVPTENIVEPGTARSSQPPRTTDITPSRQKTTADPFVFGNDYFENLTTYEWTTTNSSANKEKGKSSGQAAAAPEPVFYECRDDQRRNPADHVKYTPWVRNQNVVGKGRLLAEEEKEAKNKGKEREDSDEKTTEAATPTSLCSEISLRGVDVQLLDDQLLAAHAYKFADDELEFYRTFAAAYTRILNSGYDAKKLCKRPL